MSRYAIAYVATLTAFALLDAVWLGFVAKNFYQEQIGSLLRQPPLWSVAIAFYLLFIVGVLYFAVLPALESGSWTRALCNGALFGLFTYATYDLTNLATLKGWSVSVAAVDILWGAVISGASATAGYAITRTFAPS